MRARSESRAVDGRIAAVAAGQAGVVGRAQALAAGLTVAMIRARLASGRWQRLFPGTYLTHGGPVPRAAERWAAVLYAGSDAVLSHDTAAELWGLCGVGTGPVHISVPHGRPVRSQPGLVVHRSVRAALARHPARRPPVTRIEETVIDLTQRARTVDQVVSWLTDACGKRLTTAEHLLGALQQRGRVRWRPELFDILHAVGLGCRSPLEWRYRQRVERAHGLPVGTRQAQWVHRGESRYDDVRYETWRLVVELDGRVAHSGAGHWRDLVRDNATVIEGRSVLRYGWSDVCDRPCEVATQVVTMLRRGGWRGAVHGCSPQCAVSTMWMIP